MNKELAQSELGQRSAYLDHYTPSLLFPVLRQVKRDELDLGSTHLPFHGFDRWHGYEVSWLNEKGLPQVAIMEADVPASSMYLIESKSFKLYLNSFNNTTFPNWMTVQQTMARDLSAAAGAKVRVRLYALSDYTIQLKQAPEGESLDEQDITCQLRTPLLAAKALKTKRVEVQETLYSQLLKSNCLVTGQPDWGTVIIHYAGRQIERASLLEYIVSFRNHHEFHEQCVERIFMDLYKFCKPKQLTVEARYTRRGGLDICPIRSTEPRVEMQRYRLLRQ